jgi:hypothetical protein
MTSHKPQPQSQVAPAPSSSYKPGIYTALAIILAFTALFTPFLLRQSSLQSARIGSYLSRHFVASTATAPTAMSEVKLSPKVWQRVWTDIIPISDTSSTGSTRSVRHDLGSEKASADAVAGGWVFSQGRHEFAAIHKGGSAVITAPRCAS